MRKAEYAIITRVISDERARIMSQWFDDESERLRHIETLRRTADRMSRNISVNAPEFMKAAGFPVSTT